MAVGAAVLNDAGVYGSRLKIGVAGFGIDVSDGGKVRYSDAYSDAYGRSRSRQPRVSTSIGVADMDLGFNVLTGLRYTGAWAGQGDFLDMLGGKSVRFGWSPVGMSVALDRRGVVSFGTGLKLTFDNYVFSGPYTLSRTGEGYLMPVTLGDGVKKSKFVATYIGIYCDYGITPLFKEGTGADANTLSAGLRFGF